ncbi:hypothetical protein HPP92_013591 [Vanilla planifolia]|uniref:Uncharacterized protein n=1 Tax=Vanilla planifolia TaxID=51239 RepID=A0A835R3U2_VANPL|nr:hypothetical protein HPP92_013591 [Vanilla planifolia]
MASSVTKLESKAPAMEQLFDPPDDASTKLSCESTNGVGAIGQDGVVKDGTKEANIGDVNSGVDENGLDDAKSNKNNKNLEIDDNVEEEEDLRDNGKLEKNAQDGLEGEVNKFSREDLHVEKKYSEEAKVDEETIDAKECIGKVNDCGEDHERDVEVVGELMEFEEKKDFEQNKDKEGKKIVDNLKNDDNELVGERMDVENNIVIEEIDDIRVQNTMQVINVMKDVGEKSEHRNTIDSKENGNDIDVKGDNEQKGIEEVKTYKANNIVVGLKDTKMQSVNASKVDEQMGEMETTNIEETTKANEEPNNLETMVMEVVKRDAIVNEKQEEKESIRRIEDEENDATKEDGVNEVEEKESIRRMEDEEKDATKEDGVNEVVDEGNTEMVTDENKVSNSTNDEEITKVDEEPKALETRKWKL